MNAVAAIPTWTLLLLAALLASTGQVLLKVGASDRQQLLDYVNWPLFGGLALYGLSTVCWVLALGRSKLTALYPFTALTFVFVYIGAIWFLGERPGRNEWLGLALVLGGLALLMRGHA